MKKIKEIVKNNVIVVRFRIVNELLFEFLRLYKHFGAVKFKRSKQKFEADIIIRAHAIEKGLSMSNPRPGFGELRVKNLIELIDLYLSVYKDESFVAFVFGILDAYFAFNRENNSINEKLLARYELIKDQKCSCPSLEGGIIKLRRQDVLDRINQGFSQLVSSRYSIRDFSDERVDLELIIEAIEISKKTPSACNRQPWRVYVFRNEKLKRDLLKWQGNKGFTDNIDTVIIVASSLNSFFINEKHQAYVDGGLYAMTLIYALHSKGLGTIPMTLAMMESKSRKLYREFGLKQDEVPVLMIGVGKFKESYSVAISERKNINHYVTIIE